MENEEKETIKEQTESNAQPSAKAIILFEDNGEVKFMLQGITMDEAFILATKGYTKIERAYKASI